MELARAAIAADHDACVRLVAEALSGAAAMRGGPALVGGATPEWLLDRWRTGERTALFVGEFAGAVVGVLAVVAEDEPGQGRGGVGRIECCYVEADARGVGVGTALMEAAVSWCEARGFAEIDAVALPGDRSMKQRLEAAGFTARLLTLSRRLG